LSLGRSAIARLRLVGLCVLLVTCVLTKDSFALRKIERTVTERVYGFDRYVNACVVVRVVAQAPTGKGIGWHEMPDGRRLEVLREHRRGGIIDTKASPPRIAGWCAPGSEVTWCCSEDQEAIILHPDEAPRGHLVIGSEGSGKTTALAIWHVFRWFENFGEYREGGQTAPTLNRLGLVKAEILKLWPEPWRRYANRDDFTGFELCDGSRIRFVSTAPRPEKQGSPIQGFNWSWCGRDEVQDQVDVHDDIEARGRAAQDGGTYYKQLGTATAKDDPHWRSFRDAIIAGGAWSSSRLLIERSPFVAPGFLEAKRRSGMTDREYRRRFLAEDVPPETRLYFNWSREHNLRPIPIGARKITSIVLSRKVGPGFGLLIGHDPGIAKAASVYLDAYELRGIPDPVWWVRGETFTLHATPEGHARQVLDEVRSKFAMNVAPGREQVHVRAQPVGQSEDKPDQDIYKIWRRVGFDCRAAQYRKNDSTGTGHISREARVNMVNTLFCDAVGRRRLFVECDDLRKPVAPKLVEALETIERDEQGRISRDKRLDRDKSDPPDALGYALWPWEKVIASALQEDVRQHMRGA
jgi:hypothetical protein